MKLAVVKRNKRLYIVDESGKTLYTPPDFLRPYVTNRDVIKSLAEEMSIELMEKQDTIRSIMRFEGSYDVRAKRRRRG